MSIHAIAWHVTLRLDRDYDRVITTTAADTRRAARRFLRFGRPARLLAFGVADTHMHALLACDRARAGRFVHDLEVSLRHALGLTVPFAPARFTTVESQPHLRRAFDYVLRQDDRHDLGRDPFRDGTSLPDLVGARLVGAWMRPLVRSLLPREGQASLVVRLPWGHALTSPVGLEAMDLLAEAAGAAALVPELTGRTPEVVAARTAAIQLAADQVRPGELAGYLGVSPATLRRLRQRPADPALVHAIRLQLRMRHARRAAGAQL